MSEGNVERGLAYEALADHSDAQAIVHALLAIRAELRTANLLTAVASELSSAIIDGLDNFDRLTFPTAAAVLAEIREELDIDDRGER